MKDGTHGDVIDIYDGLDPEKALENRKRQIRWWIEK